MSRLYLKFPWFLLNIFLLHWCGKIWTQNRWNNPILCLYIVIIVHLRWTWYILCSNPLKLMTEFCLITSFFIFFYQYFSYLYQHFLIKWHCLCSRYLIGLVVCLFLSFRTVPIAYGGTQARGRIRAAAAGLHHSHRNARSEPHLWPTHNSWQRQILNPLMSGIKCESSSSLPLSHNRNSLGVLIRIWYALAKMIRNEHKFSIFFSIEKFILHMSVDFWQRCLECCSCAWHWGYSRLDWMSPEKLQW